MIEFDFSNIPNEMGKALYIALNSNSLYTKEEVNTATAYLSTAQEPLKSFILSVFNEQSILSKEEEKRKNEIFKTDEEKELYSFAFVNNYPYEILVEFVLYQKSKGWKYKGEKIKNPIGAFVNFVRSKK